MMMFPIRSGFIEKSENRKPVWHKLSGRGGMNIIDIIMQVLEHVGIQNLIGVFSDLALLTCFGRRGWKIPLSFLTAQASPPLLSEAKAVGGTCLFQ